MVRNIKSFFSGLTELKKTSLRWRGPLKQLKINTKPPLTLETLAKIAVAILSLEKKAEYGEPRECMVSLRKRNQQQLQKTSGSETRSISQSIA